MPAVLFVGDDPRTFPAAQELAGMEPGLTVATSRSVPDAIAAIGQQKYDVIVADVPEWNTGCGEDLKPLISYGNSVALILLVKKITPELASFALENDIDLCVLDADSDPGQTQLTFRIRHAIRKQDAINDLLHSNSMLRKVSSKIRHDINNKLTILSGYSQLMEMESLGPKLEGYVAIMRRAVSETSGLLAYSREYEKAGSEPALWQDIKGVIAEAVPHDSTASKKLAIETGSVRICADPLLGRVFETLLNRALVLDTTVTTLRIRRELAGDDLLLIIEDDGRGFPPEEKERIFDIGYAKDPGPAFFLSRKILAVTGIGIRETAEPGHGARFEILVPRGMYCIE